MPQLHLRFLCLFLMLATALADDARAEEVVRWPAFPFPALFIMDRGIREGFGFEIHDALAKRLPQYRHIAQVAPPRRIFADAERGEHVVLVGPLKTPERERFLVYSSVPCALSMPSCVVLRREDIPILAPEGVFPTHKALAAQCLRWGFQDGVNLGQLHQALAPCMDAPGTLRQGGPDPIPSLLRMVRDKRLDWFPSSSMVAAHYMERLGLGDTLAMVPAQGAASEPNALYLACPRTPWGEEMMRRLDKALVEEIRSGNLKRILLRYVPDSQRPLFMKHYEARILAPALKFKPTP